jgi:hypothetical protein
MIKDVQWTEVGSSMLKAVAQHENDLLVEFKKGDVYLYPGLAAQFDLLLAAESVGKHFHQYIREQECQRLTTLDLE